MTTPMAQLRHALSEVFDGLRAGTINTNVARSLTYTATAIIKSCQVEVEYAFLRQEKPSIGYLDAPTEPE